MEITFKHDRLLLINTCSKYFEYAIVLTFSILIILLPNQVASNMPMATQTGKFFFFIKCIIPLFLISCIKTIICNNVKVNLLPIDIFLGVLTLYMLLNRYLIHNVMGYSFQVYELLGLVSLYVILRNIKGRLFKYIILAVSISGVLESIVGFRQLLGHYPRFNSSFQVTGHFINPGPFAGYISLCFTSSLGLFLFHKRIDLFGFLQNNRITNRLNEYLPFLLLFIMGCILPATQSRAAWLAIGVSSLTLLIVKYRKELFKVPWLQMSRWKTIFLLLILLIVSIWGSFYMYSLKEGSANGRLLIWQSTWSLIQDNPFFGVGFDLFKAHYMSYQAGFLTKNRDSTLLIYADDIRNAFNELLQFTAENGVIGLLILCIAVTILLKNIKSLEANKNPLIYTGLGILISYFVFSFFSYPNQILTIKLIGVVALALLACNTLNGYQIEIKAQKIINTLRFGVVPGLISITVFMWTGQRKLAFATKKWEHANSLYRYLDYKSAKDEYENLYAYFSGEGAFLGQYGKALVMVGEYENAINVLKEAVNYQNSTTIQTAFGDSYKALGRRADAERAYSLADQMIPNRLYPKYLLATFYYENGDMEKLNQVADRIMKQDIKIMSRAVNEIRQKVQDMLSNEDDTRVTVK